MDGVKILVGITPILAKTLSLNQSAQEACLLWLARRSAGGWFRTPMRTLGLLHQHDYAAALGMSRRISRCPDPLESWVQREEDVWSQAFKLNIELASARLLSGNITRCLAMSRVQPRDVRCWSQSQHSYLLPQLSVGVFHPDPAVANKLMGTNKLLFDRCLAAHEYCELNSDTMAASLRNLLRDLQFPRWQIVLEWWGTCQQQNWNPASDEIREWVTLLYGSPSNTKWSCEDPFAHLAHCSSSSNKGYAKMNKHLGSLCYVSINSS